MDIKEGLKKIADLIKVAFSEVPAPAPENIPIPAQTFVDYKLADGTVLSIDKLEVGGSVKVGDVDAPDGEYKLEDGTSVQVVAGKIAELSSATEDLAPEEMANTQMKAELEAVKKELAEYKAGFVSYTKVIAAQNDALKEMNEVLAEFAEQGKQKPTEVEVSFDDMTPLQRRRAMKG